MHDASTHMYGKRLRFVIDADAPPADLPRPHLLRLARLDAWELPDLAAPWWRCYLPVDAGAAVVHAGERVPLVPGEALLIAPGTHCRATAARPFRKAYAHFAWEPGGRSALPGLHRVVVGRSALRSISGGPAFGIHLLALVARACAAVPASAFTSVPTPGPLVRRAMELLDREGPPPANRALAKTLGLHAHSLGRLFIRETGVTPQAWAREQRMRRAAQLLAATAEPIEAIAARCGCWDRNHFTRLFTRRWQTPPAAFRRRERHDDGGA